MNASSPLEPEIDVFVSHPMWMLGAELESPGRQYVLLIPETALQPLQSFFDLSLAGYFFCSH